MSAGITVASGPINGFFHGKLSFLHCFLHLFQPESIRAGFLRSGNLLIPASSTIGVYTASGRTKSSRRRINIHKILMTAWTTFNASPKPIAHYIRMIFQHPFLTSHIIAPFFLKIQLHIPAFFTYIKRLIPRTFYACLIGKHTRINSGELPIPIRTTNHTTVSVLIDPCRKVLFNPFFPCHRNSSCSTSPPATVTDRITFPVSSS